MLKAGELRHRITIQQNTGTTSDGKGNVTPVWADYATVWAKIGTMNPTDRYMMGQTLNVEPLRFSIRYRSDITITNPMRISFNGRIYDIKSVTNVDMANHTLEIVAEYNSAL